MKALLKYSQIDDGLLVKKASFDKHKRLELKRSLVPMAEEIADMYIAKYSLSDSLHPSLTNMGMASFNRAFNDYLRKVNMFEDNSYTFTSYFSWWVRQYILLYLQQLNIIPKI